MKTLTDHEQTGFLTEVNLADGHAYQGLTTGQEHIVDRLGEIWRKSEAESIPDSEHRYVERLSALIGSSGLLDAGGHLILPTASNAIDVIAAYLHLTGRRVLLTHPTFDNLALILRRRGVAPLPISEQEIADPERLARRLTGADVLFLVNPNNPTGTNLGQETFTAVVHTCAQRGVTVVVDASFRFFYPQSWDSYQVLREQGASYIVFEDTGKVFPTQDMKASLLAYSPDHGRALREIYNEIYLCVSKFTLEVLGHFLDEAHVTGLDASVHALVAARRAHLRQALGERTVEPASRESRISVEWLSVASLGRTDHEALADLRAMGLGVLPGRGFFWHRPDAEESVHHIRVSLMRPRDTFDRGVAIIADYFARHAGNDVKGVQ